MANELFICWSESDISKTVQSPVVLSNVVSEVTDEEEMNGLYDRLRDLNVNHPFEPPVYQIVCNQIWGEGGLNDHPPRTMETLIPVYRHLRTCVDSDTEVIRAVGVSGRYLDLLRDLANTENLRLDVQNNTDESWKQRRKISKAVLWLMFSVVDALVTLTVRTYFQPTDAEILVKYPLFRSETFKPIEQRLSEPIDRTFTLLTISYLIHGRQVLEDKNVIPIRCFDTLPGMFSEYQFLARLCYDLIVGGQFNSAVIAAVEDETGFRLERTVGRLTVRGVIYNLDVFLYYGAANRITDRADYSSVLLTTSGPSGRSISYSSIRETAKLFILPHSIQHPRSMIDYPMYTAKFVEGTIAEQAMTRSREGLIPVGMPKHIKIREKKESINSGDERSTRRLLLATQPFNNHLRRKFILGTVPVVLKKTDWTVIIKLHPAESATFYRELLATEGIKPKENDRVIIATDGLHKRIRRSDLLVNISSNVGVESIILGTPVACYNPRPPDVRYPLYAKHKSVPQIRTPDDLVNLISAYDATSMYNSQKGLINGPYNVVGNTIDKIADKIESEITK